MQILQNLSQRQVRIFQMDDLDHDLDHLSVRRMERCRKSAQGVFGKIWPKQLSENGVFGRKKNGQKRFSPPKIYCFSNFWHPLRLSRKRKKRAHTQKTHLMCEIETVKKGYRLTTYLGFRVFFLVSVLGGFPEEVLMR